MANPLMSRASRVLSLLAVAALASALTALYFDNKQRTHVEPSDHVVVEHAPAPPLREVRIGYFKNLWLTSVYGGIVSAMDEVGSEFAKVGIHAIFVPFDSSVELAKALVKGDVDMASQTVDQFVTLLHEHPELKAAPVLLTSRTDRNVALIVGKGRHAKLTGKYIATTLAGRSYAQSAVTLAGLQVKVSTARVRGTCELVDPEAPVAEHLREDFVTPHQLTVFQDECKAAPDFAAIALLGDEIKTAMADGDERYEPKAKIKLSGMLVARTGPGSLTKQQLIDFSSAFLKGVNRLANIEHDSAAIKALQTVFDGVSGQGFAEALSLVDIAGKCENEPFAGLRPSSTWQTYLEACEEACDLFDLDPKSCKEEDQTALAERLRSIDVPCGDFARRQRARDADTSYETVKAFPMVFFDTNKSALRDSDLKTLRVIVPTLKRVLKTADYVTIRAFADAMGNERINLALSKARAKAIFEYLLAREIPADKLRWEGMGVAPTALPNQPDSSARHVQFEVTQRFANSSSR